MREKFIPLSVPNLKGNELKYVTTAVETEWVSTGGPYVNDFENKVAEYVHAEGAVSCQNGTSGLHTALLVAGVTREDAVIVPTLTFIAAVNPVRYIGAYPVFMDCDDSLCMDPNKLKRYCEQECEYSDGSLWDKKSGKHVKALIVVHVFGNMADMESILAVAKKYNLVLIEDATEAIGTYYTEGKLKGKYAGTIGDIGIYSFNGNKIITTGGGGAILTNDEELAQRAKHITTTAKVSHPYEFVHDEIGYNYRMPNLNAALGCAQLEQLPVFLKEKRKLANRYERLFSSVSNIRFFKEPENSCSNYWLNVLLLEQSDIIMRDQWLDALNQNGIMSRPIWKPIHQLEMYRDCPAMPLDTTMKLAGQVINIPSSANLNEGL